MKTTNINEKLVQKSISIKMKVSNQTDQGKNTEDTNYKYQE